MRETMEASNKNVERRKIYGTLDDILKSITEIGELSVSITSCLNRMDNSMIDKAEIATVLNAPVVKPTPFEEMDLFGKISHIRHYLSVKVDDLNVINNRFNNMV